MWPAIIGAAVTLITLGVTFLSRGDFHSRWRESIKGDVELLRQLPAKHPARDPLSRAIENRVRVYVRKYGVRDDLEALRRMIQIRRDRALDFGLWGFVIVSGCGVANAIAREAGLSARVTDVAEHAIWAGFVIAAAPATAALLLTVRLKRLPPPPED